MVGFSSVGMLPRARYNRAVKWICHPVRHAPFVMWLPLYFLLCCTNRILHWIWCWRLKEDYRLKIREPFNLNWNIKEKRNRYQLRNGCCTSNCFHGFMGHCWYCFAVPRTKGSKSRVKSLHTTFNIYIFFNIMTWWAFYLFPESFNVCSC